MLPRRTLQSIVSLPRIQALSGGRRATIATRWQSSNATTPKVVVPPTPPIAPQTPTAESIPPPTIAAGNDSNGTKKDPSSTISLILASFILGAGLAYFVPLSEIAKLTAMERLPEPGTPEVEAFKSQLEEKLLGLKLYKKLSADPGFEQRRAWSNIDSNTLNATLTSGTLSVPGGFAIEPVIFVNQQKKEQVAIIHVGQKLCGYPFLIHGGILASILDEVLKRGSCFKFGMDPLNGYEPSGIKTNLIELQYKFPTLANNFIVVRTSINEKGQVIGDVETLKGRLLVNGLGEFEKRPVDPYAPTTSPQRKKWFGIF